MRCFHFYIDDWLIDKRVNRMDALEERGYLRLIIHAAGEPDHGLPTDDFELADISLLREQWFEPTKDPRKRFPAYPTSGSKLRDCFEDRAGRLFNVAVPIAGYKHSRSRGYYEAMAGKVTRELRQQIFARDLGRCVECGGQDDLTADHRMPISRGGRTELNNLQTLCRPCNARKGSRYA